MTGATLIETFSNNQREVTCTAAVAELPAASNALA